MRHSALPLHRDARGVTVVEFAVVLPVMLLTIMGLGDLGYRAYLQSVLDGAVQKSGRDSALESGPTRTAAVDAAVAAQVRRIARTARLDHRRLNYTRFGHVGPEDYTDSNGNGVYDARECFVDVNGNGVWDREPGRTGQGRAHDVVLYTVTVDYPRIFPLGRLMGWSGEQRIMSRTVLRNQPFNRQQSDATRRICPT